MDLRFRPEEESWRAEVRAFLDRELPPEFEFETEFDESEERWEFALAFSKKVAARGWTALTWPRAYGGQEAPFIKETIFRDEFAYRGAPLVNSTGLGLAAQTLLKFSSEEQKLRFLPDIGGMRVLWAEGLTEPNAGSDLAGLQTRAARDGAGWVVNGQKTLVTWAHRCDVLYLAARTDPDAPRHTGISIFCLPLRAPGVTIQPLLNIGGGRQNHIFLDNVRIGGDMLVGQVNEGWRYFTNAFYGGAPMGTEWAKYKRAFDELVKFCRAPRPGGGEPLSRDPIIRDKLVDLAMDFEVLKLVEYEEIWRLEQRLEPEYGGAIGVVFMKEFIPKFARLASDILGPSVLLTAGSEGAVLRGRLAHLYMQSYGTHAGGTPQTKRVVVARRGLGLPR